MFWVGDVDDNSIYNFCQKSQSWKTNSLWGMCWSILFWVKYTLFRKNSSWCYTGESTFCWTWVAGGGWIMWLLWEERAWEDYLYWQTQDKRTLKRINALISDIKRTPFEGRGKPEPLRGNLSGYWSRRIDEVNRIVYFE